MSSFSGLVSYPDFLNRNYRFLGIRIEYNPLTGLARTPIKYVSLVKVVTR